MFAADDAAWHRTHHFERHGGRVRHWRRIPPKATTSAPGSDWCRSRSRRATAQSSERYQGAAIATYAFCWCKPRGFVLVRVKCWERYGLRSWIEAAQKRLHHNVLAIALANKLARIACAVLNKGRAFESVKTSEMASRPPDPRAELGAVKAQPDSGIARREDSTTADLEGPCARRLCACRPGRGNDRQARTKERREAK